MLGQRQRGGWDVSRCELRSKSSESSTCSKLCSVSKLHNYTDQVVQPKPIQNTRQHQHLCTGTTNNTICNLKGKKPQANNTTAKDYLAYNQNVTMLLRRGGLGGMQLSSTTHTTSPKDRDRLGASTNRIPQPSAHSSGMQLRRGRRPGLAMRRSAALPHRAVQPLPRTTPERVWGCVLCVVYG